MKNAETDFMGDIDLEIKTLKTESFEMRYFSFGEGTKDFVIIPGLSILSVMDSADKIAEEYAAISGDYKVWVFDRISTVPDGYGIRDMAFDTAKAMKQLKIQNACLYGTSQGGMIALVIAEHFPELVDKLALASCVARIPEPNDNTVAGRWIRLAKEGKIHELNLSFTEMVLSPAAVMKYRPLISESEKSITEEDLKRFVILAYGGGEFNAYDELDQIKCPVLVIGSEKDRVLGPSGIQGMKEIAAKTNGEIYLYEDFGHAVFVEAPDFKDRLKEFFREVSVEELVVREEEKVAENDKGTKAAKTEGLRIPLILLGAVLYAIGLNIFLRPLHLYSGGLMGFAQLIQHFLSKAGLTFGGFDISGILYYILNIPGLVLAATKMRKRFVFKTVFAVTIITILLSVIPIPKDMVLDDRLANTIIAGLLCGSGIGIILRAGASDGGMSIIGMVILSMRGKGSVGQVSLITNIILYGIMLFVFDIPTVIYSLIYSAFSSIASDKIHTQNIVSQVMVITKLKDTKPMEVEVMGRLHRGMTQIDANGIFTGEPVKMFIIFVSKYEVSRLRGIVKAHDPNAFIVETEGVRVDGNFAKKLT